MPGLAVARWVLLAGPAAGAAVGTMTSFWDLGILAAGPAGGLVAESLGFRAVTARMPGHVPLPGGLNSPSGLGASN